MAGKHATRATTYGLITFVRRHPARVYGVVTSLLALIATYVPHIPQDAILALVGAILWGGGAVQRCEDDKTRKASQDLDAGARPRTPLA
ncbi:hypothetical protein ACFU99_00785 [Streptomyces sp. NPDC057654]|uniref:hypothetical protein n=1 Tax=Streptomyces sp. NPDC057654 TaxID=3346196 RepID=UPI0036B6A05D